MKRIWRLSDAAQSELFGHHSPKPKTLTPHSYTLTTYPNFRSTRDVVNNARSPSSSSSSSSSQSSSPDSFHSIISLFKYNPSPQDDLAHKLNHLRDELVRNAGDSYQLVSLLEDNGCSFFWNYKFRGVNPFAQLLHKLSPWPYLGLEVFYWRRTQEVDGTPMTSAEYAKAITFAGKINNVELALELFDEAATKRVKSTSVYNALMSAYVLNGHTAKCQTLFRNLKKDPYCKPTIVTYNILLSVFGRLMLVDHMEATLRGITELKLYPNVSTYNNLIAGYITAWMWDKMERTFRVMKESHISPDTNTYLLMLRGYAHSGDLVKMEEMYDLVRHHVDVKEISLIRTMICAYCKSSTADRMQKIHKLLKRIPENQYRPWLNVLLIRLYAKEDCFEAMEKSIDEAFEHRTAVYSIDTMQAISASYYRCKDVDKLANFVKRAECARWTICRSLYHCKMVMYALEQRFEEMENVLGEMENFNLDRTKKTFAILHIAYSMNGQKNKAAQILGLMWKHGYEVPLELFPS